MDNIAMLLVRIVRFIRRQTWLFVTLVFFLYVSLQILNGFSTTQNNEVSRRLAVSYVKGVITGIPESTTSETKTCNNKTAESNSDPIVVQDQVIKSGTTYLNLEVRHQEALLYGIFRNYTSYMTIGVPTVKRDGISYLEDTLNSLIQQMSRLDQEDVVIVVYIGDRNHTWVTERAEELYKKYKPHVENGLIQLVHPQHELYPNFGKLKRNFNDSQARVTWRSKQNIDYAYLFLYSKNISTYYVQLEDDVTAAKNFVGEIRKFVTSKSKSKQHWFCLQFSNLGFIGKLFRSSDLQTIADFLLMFYAEQPGDLLLNYLKRVMTQFKDIVKKPALFQHKGVVSSLHGKRQFQVEKSFREGPVPNRKKYYNKNPPAEIETTMELYEDNHPEYAYDLSDRFFWAVGPAAGSYYRFIFHKPQIINGIYVDTGHKHKPKDIIRRGILKISVHDEPEKKPCTDLKAIATFINGDVDTRKLNITKQHVHEVDCVSIEVTNSQTDWVVIREIAIFTHADLSARKVL